MSSLQRIEPGDGVEYLGPVHEITTMAVPDRAIRLDYGVVGTGKAIDVFLGVAGEAEIIVSRSDDDQHGGFRVDFRVPGTGQPTIRPAGGSA